MAGDKRSARSMIGKPGGFSFARGEMTPDPVDRMPAMKPMPSHTPNAPAPLQKRPNPFGDATRPSKRAPIQRRLVSGGR